MIRSGGDSLRWGKLVRHGIWGILVWIVLAHWPLGALAQTADRVTRIGVMAFRGAQSAEDNWRNLGVYLSQSVPGWSFEIVPITLVSAPEMIKAKRIDFLVTNPGHFVVLAKDHPLSALATRERLGSRVPPGLLTFGTAIFTRKDSGIRTIGELKGKSLAAVSPEAFGGFQVAWDELRRQGIDAFTDLDTIHFMGFPQDAIVTSVLNGDMDAGVIRSGLLEKLQAEGHIDLADFEVLDSKSQPDYPYLVTGHLYPEWPFLALPWIDKTLREDVSLALLNTQDPQIRARFGLLDIWSTPMSYGGVRQLLTDFRARPRGAKSPVGWMSQNPSLTAFALGVLLSLFVGATLLLVLRHIPVRTATGDAPDSVQTQAVRAKFDSLTRREREVLCLICNGHGSKAIAEALGISPKTVEFHRANLLQKTQAGTTAHLVQLTTRLGFDLETHQPNLNPAPQI